MSKESPPCMNTSLLRVRGDGVVNKRLQRHFSAPISQTGEWIKWNIHRLLKESNHSPLSPFHICAFRPYILKHQVPTQGTKSKRLCIFGCLVDGRSLLWKRTDIVCVGFLEMESMNVLVVKIYQNRITLKKSRLTIFLLFLSQLDLDWMPSYWSCQLLTHAPHPINQTHSSMSSTEV
nr:hypothetical protein F07H5.5 - Caenorhabditis elegans [Caenorhabditis elegans]